MNVITIKPYNECKTENFLEMTEAEFGDYRVKCTDPDGGDRLNEPDLSNHHEIITGRCRPYFDFERDFDDEETMKKHRTPLLIEAHNEIKRFYRGKKTDKTVAEIIMGDSSGYSAGKNQWRVSARFFVRGAGYYRKPEHMKPVAEKLAVSLTGLDLGVYYTNKTMRNFYCHKEGDNRTLRRAIIEKGKLHVKDEMETSVLDETWRDWLVTDIFQRGGKETKCLSPEEESDSEDEREEQPIPYKGVLKIAEIRAVLKRLSDKRAVDRNLRRPVITVLARIAEYQDTDLRDLAHEFGAKAGDNYDEQKVDGAYDNPDPKIRATWKTIQNWADEDSGAVAAPVEDKAPKSTFYNDVRQLLLKQDLSLEEVNDYMLGCVAKISNNGNPVFFQRGEDEWTLLEGGMPFASEAENYTFSVPNPNFNNTKKVSAKNCKSIELEFKKVFKALQQQQRFLDHCSYDRANFKPFMGESPYPKRMFNLFKGFRFQPRADFKPTGKCDMLLRHIREVLAGGGKPKTDEEIAKLSAKQKREHEEHVKRTDEYFDYIMNWIAQMFQQPDQKLGKCLVFRSKPRAGKNTVFDFIRRKLLPEYSSEITDMDSLTQKHNTHRMNQIFTVLNEVGNFGGDKRKNDKMKSIITDLQIFIEPKGMKGFFLDDVCRYAMLTNNAWPCDMNDERQVPFQCSNHRCGDVKYFEELHASLTDECAEEFFQILMQRDLKGRNLRVVPKTAMGEELLAYAESTTNKFFLDVADREVQSVLIDDEVRIHRDPLYDEYVAWAKRGNAFVQQREKFLDEMAKLGLALKPVRIPSGSQQRGILCKLDDLRKLLNTVPAFANYTFQD